MGHRQRRDYRGGPQKIRLEAGALGPAPAILPHLRALPPVGRPPHTPRALTCLPPHLRALPPTRQPAAPHSPGPALPPPRPAALTWTHCPLFADLPPHLPWPCPASAPSYPLTCAHWPLFADLPPQASLLKHCPLYDTHSAPCTKASTSVPGVPSRTCRKKGGAEGEEEQHTWTVVPCTAGTGLTGPSSRLGAGSTTSASNHQCSVHRP